jgi:uncharacterized cupredoxin-like copper-binding protein
MKARNAISAALLALALAACQGGGHRHDGHDYVRDWERIVKETDWGRMITVEIDLYDYGYRPRDLRLKADQPYKLVLKNTGNKDHYYTAPEFFRAVATRKAMVNRFAEIKAPYFTAVEVFKNGGELDLYVVPVRRGTYRVHCPIDDHEEKGSTGTITVE